MVNRRRTLKLLCLGLTSVAGGSFSQTSSGRPIRVIVPLPAGTNSDNITRMFAPLLGVALGQPVIVENKPGANGVIAIQELMRSAPDGNTLLMGTLSPFAINVALMKNLPYDPRKDLTPLSGLYTTSQALMVRSSSPLRTLAEFVAYARQNPGRVSVGHSTTLVQAQIGVLAAMAGVTLLPVPYKGIPATITDTIGGNLDATFVDMSNALAHAKSGNLRALAVTAPTRNPIAPDWPTVAETFPGYDFRSWVALVGPAGMPRELVLKLNTAMNNILRQRDFSDKLAHNGITPWVQNADDLKVFMSADIDRWIKLAREHNLMPE